MNVSALSVGLVLLLVIVVILAVEARKPPAPEQTTWAEVEEALQSEDIEFVGRVARSVGYHWGDGEGSPYRDLQHWKTYLEDGRLLKFIRGDDER
jgi:hypothetical protein